MALHTSVINEVCLVQLIMDLAVTSTIEMHFYVLLVGSTLLSIRPQSFFDFNEIWHVGTGR